MSGASQGIAKEFQDKRAPSPGVGSGSQNANRQFLELSVSAGKEESRDDSRSVTQSGSLSCNSELRQVDLRIGCKPKRETLRIAKAAVLIQ